MTEYYDGWQEKTYICPDCSWQGHGEECRQGNMYRELFALSCPKCGEELDTISFPRISDTQANWDKASEADKLMATLAEQSSKVIKATKLYSTQQLPGIHGNDLVLVWDYQSPRLFDSWTVIRYGNEIVWREKCGWEVYNRFVEVLKILKDKYGRNLVDVAPTYRSYDSLCGDRFTPFDILRARSILEEKK